MYFFRSEDHRRELVDYAIQSANVIHLKRKISKVIETPCQNCQHLSYPEIEKKLQDQLNDVFELENQNTSIKIKILKLEKILEKEMRKPCNKCGHTYKYIPSAFELGAKCLEIQIKSSENTDLNDAD